MDFQTSRYKTAAGAALLVIAVSANAGSPPNISTNIPWTGGTTGSTPSVYVIEQSFNYGRRQEEAQIGLTSGTIKNLVLPPQATWDAMSDDAKALYLLNDERTSRAGMQAGVLGKPYAGVESAMDGIATAHAQYLLDNNLFKHSSANGDSSYVRQDKSPIIGESQYRSNGGDCHEFSRSSENLSRFSETAFGAVGPGHIKYSIPRAIFNWNYNDAGSNWGHREASLAQDVTFVSSQNANQPGYTDNNGTAGQEGYIGVSFMEDASYLISQPPAGNNGWGTLVVVNMFDPVSDADATANNCAYSVTQTTAALPAPRNACDATLSLPNNQWRMVSLPCNPGASKTVADVFGDDLTGTYGTDWILYGFDGTAYAALTASSVLEFGKGYWVIQVSGSSKTVDMPSGSYTIPGTPSDVCASSGGCQRVALSTSASKNVYAMVGRPFAISTDISSTMIETNSSGNCSAANFGCTLAAEKAANRIFGPWAYNGSAYTTPTTVNPWEGFWFAASSSINGHAPALLLPLY